MADATAGASPDQHGAGMQNALANLDPSLAAVLGQLLTSTNSVDNRISEVEASQKAMGENLQAQINALSAAVHGTDNTGGRAQAGIAEGGIEHVFQRGVDGEHNIEAIVQQQIERAVNFGGLGQVDPFAVVHTAEGGDMPANT